MNRKFWIGLTLGSCLAVPLGAVSPPASAAEVKVISDQTVAGFKFPESVAYDARNKVLYVGAFGSELKPAEKDGKGWISKVSLDGKILEEKFLPAAGQILNKPKGLWVRGNRLWVADIDGVWVFDTKTKEGKKLSVPEMKYVNDVAIMGKALYVTDNRNDLVLRVEPADFLKAKKDPKVTVVFTGKSVNPNGIYPAKDGALLLAGFGGKDAPRGLYSIKGGGDPKPLSKELGMLDGLYEFKDGSLLSTDWVTGSLFHWDAKGGMKQLATGFKGPADFCVVPDGKGLLVVVPDLVKSELRFVRLGQ